MNFRTFLATLIVFTGLAAMAATTPPVIISDAAKTVVKQYEVAPQKAPKKITPTAQPTVKPLHTPPNTLPKAPAKPAQPITSDLAKKAMPAQTANSLEPSFNYTPTKSLDIVANPTKYVNKRVKVKAKFDKFSTLGLDYSKAMRSSEKYIGILIKRDDVTTHNIPLAQMKIFMLRTEAEKHIDLETGDDIEFDGIVFSNALNDAWVEVETFKVLTKKEKK